MILFLIVTIQKVLRKSSEIVCLFADGSRMVISSTLFGQKKGERKGNRNILHTTASSVAIVNQCLGELCFIYILRGTERKRNVIVFTTTVSDQF